MKSTDVVVKESNLLERCLLHSHHETHLQKLLNEIIYVSSRAGNH